jgi:hypothetical protein
MFELVTKTGVGRGVGFGVGTCGVGERVETCGDGEGVLVELSSSSRPPSSSMSVISSSQIKAGYVDFTTFRKKPTASNNLLSWSDRGSRDFLLAPS